MSGRESTRKSRCSFHRQRVDGDHLAGEHDLGGVPWREILDKAQRPVRKRRGRWGPDDQAE